MNRLSHLLLFSTLWLLAACGTTSGDTNREEELELNNFKGKAYMERNNPQMALVPLRRVQELDPTNVDNLVLLGSAYYHLERPLQAIATYQKALELRQSGELYNRLGMVYLSVDNIDEAVKYFKLALEDPHYLTQEESYYYLAMIEKSRKNSETMIELLGKALKIKPDHIPSHLELAGHFHFQGKFHLEQDHLNAILSVESTSVTILEKLANSYKLSGDMGRYQNTRQKIRALPVPAGQGGGASRNPETKAGMIHENK